MKDKDKNTKKKAVCPGCSKHCPLSNPKCKYGQKYAAKQKEKEEARKCTAPETALGTVQCRKKHACKRKKWENYVQERGLAWKLIASGRKMKKILREGKTGEEALFAQLNEADRRVLEEILDNLYLHMEDFHPENRDCKAKKKRNKKVGYQKSVLFLPENGI